MKVTTHFQQLIMLLKLLFRRINSYILGVQYREKYVSF